MLSEAIALKREISHQKRLLALEKSSFSSKAKKDRYYHETNLKFVPVLALNKENGKHCREYTPALRKVYYAILRKALSAQIQPLKSTFVFDTQGLGRWIHLTLIVHINSLVPENLSMPWP